MDIKIKKNQKEFNYLPNEMVLLTEKEFASSLFFHSFPREVEYRQVRKYVDIDDKEIAIKDKTFKDSSGREVNFNTRSLDVHINWEDDYGGFALVSFKGNVYFFRIGCNHWHLRELLECEKDGFNIVSGNNVLNGICINCGKLISIDSSD